MKRRRILSVTVAATVLAVGVGAPLSAVGAVGVWRPTYYSEDDTAEYSSLVSGSGGVNCRGGDVCVKQVGDSAQVSWEIQTTPLVVGSDGSTVAGGTIIAVPKVLEDLVLETIALPEPGDASDGSSGAVREVSEQVELVAQTSRLYEDESTPADLAETAPALTSDPGTWQASLYADAQLLDAPLPSAPEWTSGLNEFVTDLFITDPQMRETYDELMQVWHKLVWNSVNNVYFFERYLPFWNDAMENRDVEGLTYSPHRAIFDVQRLPITPSAQDAGYYDVPNLLAAMEAVEKEHPEVLESVDPLLGEEFEYVSTSWEGGDIGEWNQAMKEIFSIDENLYYKSAESLDGLIVDYDPTVFNYQGRDEHEAQAQDIEALYAAYDDYVASVDPEDANDFSSVENSELYNYIYIPATVDALGVSSFKLTGAVTVESDVTYLPVRVWNTTTLCSGSECQAMMLNSWANPGDLPDYSMTDADVNAEIAGLQTDVLKGVDATSTFRASAAATDGRLGSMQCAPTSELYGTWSELGSDQVQAPTRDLALYYQAHYQTGSAGNYFFSGYGVAEDGCDQADVVVTLCAEDEPTTPPTEPTTDKPEEPTEPPTEPTDPVVDTPVVDDEPESDLPVTTTDEAVADVVKTSTEPSLPKTGLSIGGLSLAAILLIAGGVVAARRTRQEV